jgi:hypothetical protein
MSNIDNLGEGSDRMDICGTLREYAALEKHSRYAATCMREAANEIEVLRERVEVMNNTLAAIRMEVGGNTFGQELHPEDFDPDRPWLSALRERFTVAWRFLRPGPPVAFGRADAADRRGDESGAQRLSNDEA